MKKKQFKTALIESARWEEQLTEYERTKIPYGKAREKVIKRVYDKFKNLL